MTVKTGELGSLPGGGNLPKFGVLESAVMDLVWSSTVPLTIRQVMDALAADRPLAYTTVQTVMDRLTRKGLLLRRPDGKANVYVPATSREDHTADAMQEALHRAGDPHAALLHFVERMDAEQEATLRAALAMRKRARRA